MNHFPLDRVHRCSPGSGGSTAHLIDEVESTAAGPSEEWAWNDAVARRPASPDGRNVLPARKLSPASTAYVPARSVASATSRTSGRIATRVVENRSPQDCHEDRSTGRRDGRPQRVGLVVGDGTFGVALHEDRITPEGLADLGHVRGRGSRGRGGGHRDCTRNRQDDHERSTATTGQPGSANVTTAQPSTTHYARPATRVRSAPTSAA